MAITQKEIAQKLGVTRVLVSRALSGHDSVAERTQKLIQETARELGYHDGSNVGAKVLAARRHGRRMRHGVLACALGNAQSRQHLPFWAQLQQGVEAAAQQAGLRIVLVNDISECENTDGLIAHAFPFRENPPFPTVNLMEKNRLVSSVVPDNSKGARLATEYLLGLGHRRVACLMDTQSGGAVTDRIKSWSRTLKRAGIEAEPAWFRELSLKGGDFLERGRFNMEDWLQSDWQKLGCTAILAQNDRAAIGVMQALQAARIHVPEDISVIGFDGTGEGELSTPRLATIAVPLREIGRVGVEILIRQIESENAAPLQEKPKVKPTKAGQKTRPKIEPQIEQRQIEQRVLAVHLQSGQSCAPPPNRY